jgi:glutamine amidotransferase
LMCSASEENDTECLGIFHEKVKKFAPERDKTSSFKVPHMGWNSISGLKSPLFDNVSEEDYFYFVHSYYATTGADTVAICDNLIPFSAALHRDNFYATQFHPEKSGETGAKILKNFINLKV